MSVVHQKAYIYIKVSWYATPAACLELINGHKRGNGQIELVQYIEHGIVGCKDLVRKKAVDKWINLLSKSSPINCVHLDKIF